MISEYWRRQGKTDANKRPGRTFESSFGLRCEECCNGDRCDDPTHFRTESCPFCLGTGKNASCGEFVKPTVYPTEPVDFDHDLGTIRIWQNGPDWWVANVKGTGEWSGPTRASVFACAVEEMQDEENELEEYADAE